MPRSDDWIQGEGRAAIGGLTLHLDNHRLTGLISLLAAQRRAAVADHSPVPAWALIQPVVLCAGSAGLLIR